MSDFLPDFLGETASRINLGTYSDHKQFVVQHLYPDTLRLLLLLHKHVAIDCVIGIGYSGSAEVAEQLRKEGIRVCTPSYEELEKTVKQELGESLARSRAEGFKLVLHEVGGYSISCLHISFPEEIERVTGAIEITKQGVWVAKELPSLQIPQLNCAETRLKEVEGKLVGEAVVAAFDNIIRELGVAMSGRAAMVVGYGWVGKGVAESLKSRGVQVAVYDRDPVKRVNAAVDGFNIRINPQASEIKDLVDLDFLIGASGSLSIEKRLIDSLPDKCFIVSGSSKNHEIDLKYLSQVSSLPKRIHEHVEAYAIESGEKTCYLVNDGYPVNFTSSSVPDEIVEFLFSEFIILMKELLENRPPPGQYPLDPELENIAANVWLDLR